MQISQGIGGVGGRGRRYLTGDRLKPVEGAAALSGDRAAVFIGAKRKTARTVKPGPSVVEADGIA